MKDLLILLSIYSDHDCQARWNRRRKGYRRRQPALETADPDYESSPTACAQSLGTGSFSARFCSLFLSPRLIQWAAVIIRPSTLLKFHCLLKQRK
jgi:hypothetical protein